MKESSIIKYIMKIVHRLTMKSGAKVNDIGHGCRRAFASVVDVEKYFTTVYQALKTDVQSIYHRMFYKFYLMTTQLPSMTSVATQ